MWQQNTHKIFVVFLLEGSHAYLTYQLPTCGQGHDTAPSGCNTNGEIAFAKEDTKNKPINNGSLNP